ncbi:MAG: histidinol-phosphate transaminase [Euryarchaeota archaeon]|nr:histidinol-phosphate transaminase [Euryarchaeota archaeon]
MNKEWVRTTVRDIPLYYNPKVKAIRMDTSTNVLGPNPAVNDVLEDCADMNLNQYPKPYSDDLRDALAEAYDLKADNFVVGNGSDEVLDIIFKTFMELGERVVAPYPSYSLHSFFVKVNGGHFETVDLTDDFHLDPDALIKARGKIIILCTPNNPTANAFDTDAVEQVIREHDGPVIVDEAYGEFADYSFMPMVNDYDNLIVTRTFSKAYGMAGLRVGYMAANIDMAEQLQKIKIPYSLNRFSEQVAIAALRNHEYIDRTIELVQTEREKLSRGLEDLGFKPYPSQSNFILFRCPVPSSVMISRLADKGILIRDFGRQRLLENCARTTVGTEELNSMLLSKLKEVMDEWQG